MESVYRNATEMTTEELVTVVTLLMELDALNDNEQPEKQVELITAMQTLIRNPEEVVVTNTEAPEESAEEEGAAAVEESEEASE